ncbi:hypothetical protein FQN54_001892 [Arachnomyces sp. PD_36]|nr:hypothetical protein FQN54_001892 [Arachnomyces sp. PD_36]
MDSTLEMLKNMAKSSLFSGGCMLALLSALVPGAQALGGANWEEPADTPIADLEKVLSGKGVYGFIFNSSYTPDEKYGQYNWCNMPHVRRSEYKEAPDDYELQYIEVIHRHHKRSPYESNLFPHDTGSWKCGSEDSLNRNCSYPQITTEGIADSWNHGRDLYAVYYELLNFIPKTLDSKKVTFRVTNNEITTQVARPLIDGMYEPEEDTPLIVQKHNDSLEPDYPCPAADATIGLIKDSDKSRWQDHLKRSKPLFDDLDAVSGVPKDSEDWHSSFDHYFDNLSARLCHDMSLPCNIEDKSACITQDQADEVFRLGQYEYSYLYRQVIESLDTSAASYGLWVGEVAQHIRDQMTGEDGEMVYRHNVAHDGSISRLLSILQIDVMVWPGMGSEVVFELYRKKKGHSHGEDYMVRVLFGGKPLLSSHPDLGLMEFIPANTLLGYFDDLVGKNASAVPEMCHTMPEWNEPCIIRSLEPPGLDEL